MGYRQRLLLWCVLEYLKHRECLERSQSSPLFVPCARLITRAYIAIYNHARTLDPASVANTTCQ